MHIINRIIVLVLLAAAVLALGSCARERHADHDSARAPAPTAAILNQNGSEEARPDPASASTISIVPASDDMLNRAATSGATIGKILATAKSTIGTPYQWGGTNLTSGIDCSNYTWLLYRSIGVHYDRYIRTQELATLRHNAGFEQTTFAEAQPGDLLVYGYRDAEGAWHGHVVILVDKTGQRTGHPGLVLGAHGTPVSAVQFVTFEGFEQGYFKSPNMRLLNVLRPLAPNEAR